MWHSFKFYLAEDVFAHLRPLLNVPEPELRDLCRSVQGRSRNWVSALQTIIRAPDRTFATICLEAVGEESKADISRLKNTPGIDWKDFIKDIAGNYLELPLTRWQSACRRLNRKHTGIFVRTSTKCIAVDVKANIIRDGVNHAPVSPLCLRP